LANPDKKGVDTENYVTIFKILTVFPTEKYLRQPKSPGADNYYNIL